MNRMKLSLLALALGGSYGGVLQALPVPEPETYFMMLVGLGVMGFMARRRKTD